MMIWLGVLFICAVAAGLIYVVVRFIRQEWPQQQVEVNEKPKTRAAVKTAAREQVVAKFSNKVARYRIVVRKMSPQIIAIRDLEYTVERKSLAAFRNFTRDAAMRYLIDLIKKDPTPFEKLIDDVYTNRSVMGSLTDAAMVDDHAVRRRDYEKAKAEFAKPVLYEEFCFCEDNLVRQETPFVVTNAACRIQVSYISPKGRSVHHNEHVFALDVLEPLVAKLTVEVDEQDEFAKKQRKLMTKKLRYRILKRDNFRCVLCGRGMADGIRQLEVDHIQPISKGGLTVPENLRTLCFDCNQGKKDEWEPDGAN